MGCHLSSDASKGRWANTIDNIVWMPLCVVKYQSTYLCMYTYIQYTSSEQKQWLRDVDHVARCVWFLLPDIMSVNWEEKSQNLMWGRAGTVWFAFYLICVKGRYYLAFSFFKELSNFLCILKVCRVKCWHQTFSPPQWAEFLLELNETIW